MDSLLIWIFVLRLSFAVSSGYLKPALNNPAPYQQGTYIVVQFYLVFFPFVFGIWLCFVYKNKFETKENKIWTKVEIAPQHL